MDSLHAQFFQYALIEAVLAGAFAGFVSVHVMLRRFSFFVVAMSHATFPGVVIASVLGISLFIGGIGFGVIVVLLIVVLGNIRRLDDSSAIGIVLAASFAIGVLILSAREGGSRDLSAFLVGQILTVAPSDLWTTGIVGTVVMLVLILFHKELVGAAFDPSGMGALGYRPRLLDLVVLLAVTVAMVTSVPAVGTLLAVALLTVPGLVARQWTERIGRMLIIGALVGAGSGFIGLCASALWNVAAGGAIALTTAAFFAVSAIARQVVVSFNGRSSTVARPARASCPAGLAEPGAHLSGSPHAIQSYRPMRT
jgi:ABC-type Mn2+/Zn2+ transport system permease subunit